MLRIETAQTSLGKPIPSTPVSDCLQSPEYELRHVMPLKPTHEWTPAEQQLALKHNRLLQDDYLNQKPAKLIALAKTTKEAWLTDFASLSIDAAIYLTICAELLTFYQVEPSECQLRASDLFEVINKNAARTLLTSRLDPAMREEKQAIFERAIKRSQEIYPELISSQKEHFQDFVAVENGRERKKQINRLLTPFIAREIDAYCTKQNILKKTVYPAGLNQDYSCLGAAASGKTSISNTYIKDKSDVVVLSTDEYRGCFLPTTLAFECTDTNDQGFIRTQDTAYLIKEMIQDRLINCKNRPNLYIDGITLECWHRKLLANNQNTTSFVACLSDTSSVAIRAFTRAKSATSPGDKQRHINTTALLDGHAKASKFIIKSIPNNTSTILYDTHVAPDQDAVVIARIEHKHTSVVTHVHDLGRMCRFLGKANLNKHAEHSARLFHNDSIPTRQFTYDALYKADAFLDCLIPPTDDPAKANYSAMIQSEDGTEKPCLKIARNRLNQNAFTLEVLDEKAFTQLIRSSKNDKQQLAPIKALILTIAYGAKADAEIKILGKENAFKMAMHQLRLTPTKDFIHPRGMAL